ncbi:MAG: SDR family oxidoreductase [Porticoccaceae bacterium]|nr:SDR family oxidoreductase [Porticoccaceae bacterium]
MDLGLRGKTAIVCASSRGLGKGCALALAAEGVNLILAARQQQDLEKTGKEIINTFGIKVITVTADVTTQEGRDRILSACPHPDILINNAGGPPPGDFRQWTREHWNGALNDNMYSAFDLIRRVIDGMAERRFGRIVNITSITVKQPIPQLGLSNGARAALTGWVSGIARDFAAANVTINNLLPGTFDTERGNAIVAARAKAEGAALENFAAQFCNNIPAGRLGKAEEFGATCAFLCSQQAAYITAQNILVDGGAYPGVF